MKSMKRTPIIVLALTLALALALTCPLLAQDMGGIFYPFARTVRYVTSDPATCLPTNGNIILRTDTATLKICSATNTWTAVGAGVGGTTGATDNRILRSDGNGGSTVQASSVTLTDTGQFSQVLSLENLTSGLVTNKLDLNNDIGPALVSDTSGINRSAVFDISGLSANRTLTVPNVAGTIAVGTFTGTGTVYVRQASPTVTTPTLNGITQLGPVLFAELGTPANGAIAFCSDCAKATPCTGSGTGALAKRLNGTWDCD